MRWDKSKEQENKEKTKDFQAKMAQGYDFKKAYAARRAWEFYNHPEVAGRCYVAVGGLDSITLFLFLRSIGINVPAVSVSMLEDRSIQIIHKALGIKSLKPAKNPQGRPYGKIEVIREFGFPVLSKETAGKINLLQHPTEKNATVRHAIMTGETGEYGGFRKRTRMKMSQKWLEKFGGPENEREGTNYQTAPFPVSDLCCYYLKEKPCDDYAKESGRFPYMGLMASEGGRQTDRDGNMVSEPPAKWEADPAGSCVAIVPLNPETMEPDGPAEVFGDWQAGDYLARVLELIHPNRQTNVPDLAAMVRAAAEDGLDLCEYCQAPYMCRDCIVKEWKEDAGDE